MKAVYFHEHGKTDQIQYGEIPRPIIAPDELLVETQVAGLNHLDLFVLRGWSGLNINLPHTMGSDGAGIVKEVGGNVFGFQEGDRVLVNPGMSCGICKQCLSGNQNLCKSFRIKGENVPGTFADSFAAPAINFLKIPDDMSFETAGAAPLNFLTAWRMLVTLGQVKNGDLVLIQGAGGGVATAAIQIAKLKGAKVITTTSSELKMEKARGIGADFVFNYKENPDYGKNIYKNISTKQGVDIVIDSVGKSTFSTSIHMLRTGGKYITCGTTTGGLTELDLRLIFWKQLQIIGSTMSNQDEFRDVMQHIFSGELKPVIDRSFPFEKGREAEQYLENGNQFGKVILKHY